MLTAIAYRMLIPPSAVNTADNSTYVTESVSVESDVRNQISAEPGPELGTSLIQKTIRSRYSLFLFFNPAYYLFDRIEIVQGIQLLTISMEMNGILRSIRWIVTLHDKLLNTYSATQDFMI